MAPLTASTGSYLSCQEDIGWPVALLKACTKQKDLYKGSRLHADIVKRGLLGTNFHVGSALINMYAKCGALDKAQEVFDELPMRNVVSWNSLIAGYTQHGHSEEALNSFERMHREGLAPDAITFTCILKACASIAATDKAQEIHAAIVRQGILKKDILVGTALVDMYAKCGELAKAQGVFIELPVHDVVSWNALIAGYAQHGHVEEALNSFEQMRCEGLAPNAVTFTCILKASGSIVAIQKGLEIHAVIVRQELLEKDIVVCNALLDMYAKCGALGNAQKLFKDLPSRDVVSWAALIAGYVQHGHSEEALNYFEQMQSEGLSPDAVTFTCILKACGDLAAADRGEGIHIEIVRKGLVQKNTVLGNALVDMYGKCGALAKAQQVFDKLPIRNVVSWTALIAGYAQHGHGEEALSCFKQMQCEGLHPDALTFVCILKACGSIAAADMGQEIHAEIDRRGLRTKNIVIGNALVDLYAKCGALAKAQEVVENLRDRNAVSWNTLMRGYANYGDGDEALNCFDRMQNEGLAPDAITFTCILNVCGSMGAADKGQEIHTKIVRQGLLEKNNVLGNTLVDMYAKCGSVVKAHEVFNELPVHDLSSWNVLIAGYAQLGKTDIVFNLFNKVLEDGIEPDPVTFTIVLNMCSHSGLLDMGQLCFETMSACYGIPPTLEHNSCMVDLFGRAGHFDKAVAVIKEMPFFANLAVWHTLLGACKNWGNVKLGRFAFEQAVHLDEKDTVAYVSMGNIYSAAGMQAMERSGLD